MTPFSKWEPWRAGGHTATASQARPPPPLLSFFVPGAPAFSFASWPWPLLWPLAACLRVRQESQIACVRQRRPGSLAMAAMGDQGLVKRMMISAASKQQPRAQPRPAATALEAGWGRDPRLSLYVSARALKRAEVSARCQPTRRSRSALQVVKGQFLLTCRAWASRR